MAYMSTYEGLYTDKHVRTRSSGSPTRRRAHTLRPILLGKSTILYMRKIYLHINMRIHVHVWQTHAQFHACLSERCNSCHTGSLHTADMAPALMRSHCACTVCRHTSTYVYTHRWKHTCADGHVRGKTHPLIAFHELVVSAHLPSAVLLGQLHVCSVVCERSPMQ